MKRKLSFTLPWDSQTPWILKCEEEPTLDAKLGIGKDRKWLQDKRARQGRTRTQLSFVMASADITQMTFPQGSSLLLFRLPCSFFVYITPKSLVKTEGEILQHPQREPDRWKRNDSCRFWNVLRGLVTLREHFAQCFPCRRPWNGHWHGESLTCCPAVD